MKAVILAGGFGLCISEETVIKPKPMIEIGGRPILWHIMKIYSHYGIDDFIICLRLQRIHDQRVFRQLFSSHIRCDHPSLRKSNGYSSQDGRTLACHPT